MKLTAANIDLPEGKADDILFSDRLIATGLLPDTQPPPGFCLRLRRRKRGRVSREWGMRYRAHGRQRHQRIGDAHSMTPAQALAKARKLRAEIDLGGDPQGDRKDRRQKDAVTLWSVIKDFLDAKTGVKAGTKRELANYLQGPLGRRAQKQGMKPYLEGLHRMPIDKIGPKEVAARMLKVAKESGEPAAIALRSKLSSLYAWAMSMGLVTSNPVIGSYKPPKQASRDRVLDDSELAQVWRALDADDDYSKATRLLICTGCRRQEVGAMRSSEFSPDMSTWTLPASRSKTGKPHTLPVTPLMREVIDSVCRRDGYDNLFGRKQFTGWAKGKAILDKKLGLRPWVTHDIRRSVATGMANIGVQPHVIEAVLNHQSGSKAGVAGIYNKSPYEREVRDAMLRWSDHVRAVITGKEHKVVALRRELA